MHVVKQACINLLFNQLQLPANDAMSNFWYNTEESYDHYVL